MTPTKPPPFVTRPLGDFRALLPVGTVFRHRPAPQIGKTGSGQWYVFTGYMTKWQVREIVERGIVVSHPHDNSAHRHLKEWIEGVGCLCLGPGNPDPIQYNDDTGLVFKAVQAEA